MRISIWLGVVLVLAVLKVSAGLTSYALSVVPAPPVPDAPAPLWNLLTITIFSATATLLVLGGGRDRRAVYLGGLYILIGAAFADHAAKGISAALPPDMAALFDTVIGGEVDAFVPLFIWLFARDFPEAPCGRRLGLVIRFGILTSLLAGTALVALNAALALQPLTGVTVPDVFGYASRSAAAFYMGLLALSLAGLPPIAVKARGARAKERRRVGVFGAALVLGLGPVSLTLLLEALSPAYRGLVTGPSIKPFYDAAIFLLLMSVPLATTYSVLVEHVLDVKLVVRKTLRYALTRLGVGALTSVPFAGLAVYLYRHRSEPLAALFSGPRPLALFGLCVLGLLGLSARRALLEAIDRRFFREQFDARRTLAALVESTRSATALHELAGLIGREIDRALHVDSISVLIRDHAGVTLVAPDGACRPLPTSWALTHLAASCAGPFEVDLGHPRSPLRRLPEQEQKWLSDAAIRLLVPMLAGEATLIGLIVLGNKRSELPFDRDDQELLAEIAAAGALTVENLLLREQTPLPQTRPRSWTDTLGGEVPPLLAIGDELALECPRCRIFHAPGTACCASCGGSLVAGQVPHIVAGKFRIQSLIGSGGMGVVYLASDLTLGRLVAIKTLPRVSPEHAMRLRREARAAAAVSHPNLATIFGVETWRDVPMLIFEFVEDGTLADRLVSATYSPAAVIRMGLTLADVLDHAHQAGIIHGDIKPSNIAFQRNGTIKLLDFGVARLLHTSAATTSRSLWLDAEAATRLTGEIGAVEAGDCTTRLFGTLAYLSPEALGGDPVSPTFDLWSLALVMYESLLGQNPMAGCNALDTMRRISESELPDLRRMAPACPPSLAEFLEQALSRDPADRPATAKEFQRRLQQVSVGLPAIGHT